MLVVLTWYQELTVFNPKNLTQYRLGYFIQLNSGPSRYSFLYWVGNLKPTVKFKIVAFMNNDQNTALHQVSTFKNTFYIANL